MKKRMIKLLCVVAIAMAAILIPTAVFADDESSDAGMIYWAVDADNNLTISDTEIIAEEGATTGSFPADREGPPQGQSWGDWGTKIVSVTIEGNPKPRSTSLWFAQSYSLVSVDLTGLDLSECVDMSHMFYFSRNLESFTFGDNADMSKCKDMSYMFEWCDKFDFDMVASSGLDTSACESMAGMFLGCYGLTYADMSIFDTSNCKNMSTMFKYCKNMTEIDLSDIDMSACESANEMISQTKEFALRKITVGEGYKTGDIDFPFFYYAVEKGIWKNADTGQAFAGSALIPKGAGTYVYTTEGPEKYDAYWALANNEESGYDLIISPDELTGDYAYAGAYNTAIDPWAWESKCQKQDVVSVKFEAGAEDTKVKYPDLGFRYLEDDGYDEDWYSYGLFEGYSALKTADLRMLDASECANAWNLFSGCEALASVNLEGLDLSSVRDAEGLFSNCVSLKEIDLSGVTFGEVRAGSMFQYCESLENIHFNPQKKLVVIDAYYLFGGCNSMETIDLSHIDFSKCTSITSIFANNSGLQSVDFGGADLSQCTNAGRLFEGCTALKSIDLSGVDLSKATALDDLFGGCTALETAIMRGMVTTACTDFSRLFEGCAKLTTVDLTGIDTSNCTNMTYMFRGCSLLEEVDLSSFDTKKCIYLDGLFRDCTSLKTVDISHFETPVVQSVRWMFAGCTSLKTIDVSGLDMTTVERAPEMFDGCTALEQLTVGPKWRNDFPKWYIYEQRAVFPVVMFRADDGSYTEYAAGAEVPNYVESEDGCNIYVNEEKKNEENLNADIAAATAVSQQINALGEITSLDQKPDVEAARAAYEALTDAQRGYVPASEVNILEAAEAIIADLEAALLKKGDTVTIGYMVYTVTNPEAKAVSVKLTAAGKKKAVTAKIPGTVKVKDVDCKVTTIPTKGFAKAKKLKKVIGGASLVSIGKYSFLKDKKLSTFKITSTTLKKLGPKSFKACKKLKKIQLTKTTKLTKAGVKKSLASSKVKTVKVKKSKIKAYKKIFTKKNCGKKVSVK